MTTALTLNPDLRARLDSRIPIILEALPGLFHDDPVVAGRRRDAQRFERPAEHADGQQDGRRYLAAEERVPIAEP